MLFEGMTTVFPILCPMRTFQKAVLFVAWDLGLFYYWKDTHLPLVQHTSLIVVSRSPFLSFEGHFNMQSPLPAGPLCLRSPAYHWHDWARHSCCRAGQSAVGHRSRLASSWISSAAISIWTPVMWQYDMDYSIWGRVAGADSKRGESCEVG